MDSLWVSFRFQVFFLIQLWFRSLWRFTPRMWGLDLFVYHNNRINFEYIFGEYAPSLLHFQQQFLFASSWFPSLVSPAVYSFILLFIVFLWYYLAFVTVESFLLPHE